MKPLNFFLIPALCMLIGKGQPASAQSGNTYPTIAPKPAGFAMATDKAIYKPGSSIIFTVAENVPAGSYVKYMHLNQVVARQNVTGRTWKWQPPATDYTGYLAGLYTSKNGKELLLSTIAVDVSSNWAKFPRYGFLSKYPKLSSGTVQSVITQLNRYHVNGLQFYDWQNKHQQPLAGTVQHPDSLWHDIANRPTYYITVQDYIKAAHGRNMKAMFYNLVYGALNDAAQNGVDDRWYLYDDPKHEVKEKFALPKNFVSDIYFTNPANIGWQQYLDRENKKVYQVFGFDGYHMDQVGNRDKTLYDYNGKEVPLAETFGMFVKGIKSLEPNKPVVINAVNQYGQQGIAKSPVDFMYTEVWGPNDDFAALAKVITDNDTWSDYKKASVLTAYMNYDLAEHKGYFNTPSILFTDAVIFAFGGSHLELGEHMLAKEYFPNSNLQMHDDLKSALPAYYDFLVAYENLLRDGGTLSKVAVASSDGKLQLNNWQPAPGQVSVVARKLKNVDVIHFINFTNATTLNWRDNKGIQAEPELISSPEFELTVNRKVKKMWIASPDFKQASPITVTFKQTQDKVNFTVPQLKYWDMVVVEY